MNKGPIIFLHGWGVDKNCFNNLINQLPGEKVLFDLPGFGQEELPKRPWGLIDYADWVKENHLKEKGVLVGYSFGGRIAVKIAALYPELVEKLILIAGAGLRKRFDLKRLLGRILKKSSGDYQRAGALKPIFSKIVLEDLSQDLKKIKASTLLVWGEEDKETPLWIGKKMKRLIPNSRLTIFQGVDHYNILSLAASQTAKRVKDFLG